MGKLTYPFSLSDTINKVQILKKGGTIKTIAMNVQAEVSENSCIAEGTGLMKYFYYSERQETSISHMYKIESVSTTNSDSVKIIGHSDNTVWYTLRSPTAGVTATGDLIIKYYEYVPTNIYAIETTYTDENGDIKSNGYLWQREKKITVSCDGGIDYINCTFSGANGDYTKSLGDGESCGVKAGEEVTLTPIPLAGWTANQSSRTIDLLEISTLINADFSDSTFEFDSSADTSIVSAVTIPAVSQSMFNSITYSYTNEYGELASVTPNTYAYGSTANSKTILVKNGTNVSVSATSKTGWYIPTGPWTITSDTSLVEVKPRLKELTCSSGNIASAIFSVNLTNPNTWAVNYQIDKYDYDEYIADRTTANYIDSKTGTLQSSGSTLINFVGLPGEKYIVEYRITGSSQTGSDGYRFTDDRVAYSYNTITVTMENASQT